MNCGKAVVGQMACMCRAATDITVELIRELSPLTFAAAEKSGSDSSDELLSHVSV